MRFGYVIVYVSSVDDALSFYKEAFGFPTRFLHESGQYGELDTGATVLAFASYDLAKTALPGGYRKTDPSDLPLGVELAFVSDDVPAAYERAVAAGALALSAPVRKSWGQTVAYVKSREGSLIELCSPMG